MAGASLAHSQFRPPKKGVRCAIKTFFMATKKDNGPYLEHVVLDDGTELRLVPIERTGRPLYITRDGRAYSYVRGTYRQLNGFTHPRRSKKNNTPKSRVQPYMQLYRFNNIFVHHAVLLAWVGPRPEGYECDHLNGNGADNRLENLEWVTPEENRRRAVILRRQRKAAQQQQLFHSAASVP